QNRFTIKTSKISRKKQLKQITGCLTIATETLPGLPAQPTRVTPSPPQPIESSTTPLAAAGERSSLPPPQSQASAQSSHVSAAEKYAAQFSYPPIRIHPSSRGLSLLVLSVPQHVSAEEVFYEVAVQYDSITNVQPLPVFHSPGLQLPEATIRDLTSSTPTIIAGDFNAKSPSWGCTSHNIKGRQMKQMCEDLGLQISQINGSTSKRSSSANVHIKGFQTVDGVVETDPQTILNELHAHYSAHFQLSNHKTLPETSIDIERALAEVTEKYLQEEAQVLKTTYQEALDTITRIHPERTIDPSGTSNMSIKQLPTSFSSIFTDTSPPVN
ncbi:unnamed protein product, partial [Didymodactylos carnosus]